MLDYVPCMSKDSLGSIGCLAEGAITYIDQEVLQLVIPKFDPLLVSAVYVFGGTRPCLCLVPGTVLVLDLSDHSLSYITCGQRWRKLLKEEADKDTHLEVGGQRLKLP